MTIRLNWVTVKDYIINIRRAKGYYVDPWLLPRITEYYRVLPDGPHDILEGFPVFLIKTLCEVLGIEYVGPTLSVFIMREI